MKKLTFLLLLIVYMKQAFSQPDIHLDTLKKYSYLLIATSYKPQSFFDRPNLSNLHVEGYATGFFVRIDTSLFLITAYHVLTTVDVYKGVKTNSNIDFFLIRYLDTADRMTVRIIAGADIIKNNPAVFFLNTPDVYCLNVTNDFRDGKIHSLEGTLFKKRKKKYQASLSKIISFGYPFNGTYLYEKPADYCAKIQPALYEGYIADSTHYDPAYNKQNIDSLYLTCSPIRYAGTSGSPVFIQYSRGRKRWIEFAGIQSGKNEKYNCSYVVKKEELIKLLNKKQ